MSIIKRPVRIWKYNLLGAATLITTKLNYRKFAVNFLMIIGLNQLYTLFQVRLGNIAN